MTGYILPEWTEDADFDWYYLNFIEFKHPKGPVIRLQQITQYEVTLAYVFGIGLMTKHLMGKFVTTKLDKYQVQAFDYGQLCYCIFTFGEIPNICKKGDKNVQDDRS